MFLRKILRKSLGNQRGFSQYQEKCLQFEENWQSLADERNTQLLQTLEESLNVSQKNYVNSLAKAFANLNIYEVQYFYEKTCENLTEIKGVPLFSLLTDWPSVKKAGPFSIISHFFLKTSRIS